MEKIDLKAPVTIGFFTKASEELLEKIGEMLDKAVAKLTAGQVENRHRIDDLKQDTALTPTKEEFEELRKKVEQHHPTN